MGNASGDPSGGGGGATGPEEWAKAWSYNSNIDPEEFFRKIFGDGKFHESEFDEHMENRDGFGSATEVRKWHDDPFRRAYSI